MSDVEELLYTDAASKKFQKCWMIGLEKILQDPIVSELIFHGMLLPLCRSLEKLLETRESHSRPLYLFGRLDHSQLHFRRSWPDQIDRLRRRVRKIDDAPGYERTAIGDPHFARFLV